jgi:hypothetical protein
VAGRHYLTKSDLNALYFATYQLKRPRGWKPSLTVGHYWRAALVVFFNYGVDTGTIFKSAAFHEPILWRHISWRPEPPNGQGRDSRYGWLYYRRVKTNKPFLPPDESGGSGPPQKPEIGRMWAKPTRFLLRQFPPQRAVSASLRLGRRQAQARCRNR